MPLTSPTGRLSATGLAAVFAAHALVAVLLIRTEPWVPPTPESVLTVSLLPSVATAPPIPETRPAVQPPRPRQPETPPSPQIAVPEDVAATTPIEAPPPPAAPAPVAAVAPVIEPAPAAPSAAPVPTLAVTPARYDADYLDNPKPGYPPISRRLGEEGRVLLRVVVSATGLPVDLKVQVSSGFDRLDQAALSTVRRWKFVPPRIGKEPVAAPVLIPITFSLKG